ncbi:hypothetical protein L0222_04960 [bacterium]|nr:hypothetical protein [bacterium]MCI0603344.1 hypothetical protein [bacterium]
MKRVTFLFLMVIGLTFTLAACSSYPRHRYPDYRGGGYEYQLDRVENLAEDLEEATDRAYEEAEDTSHHGTDREDYALDRLRDLHEEAKDFRNEVDDHRRDPREARDEYRDLVEAYYRARESLRILHAYDEVYREFDRVSRIMAELNRLYGYGQRDPYGYR